MGQRAMARGVGVDLGAIQVDRAQGEQAHFLRDLQYLHEQASQLVEKAAAQAGQGIVTGMSASGDEAQGFWQSVFEGGWQQVAGVAINRGERFMPGLAEGRPP